MSFKCCTDRFKTNENTSEIDYILFVYDSMYNHIDDTITTLKSKVKIERYSCVFHMLMTLKKMIKMLKKYYEKTDDSWTYENAMILNSQCKLALFDEDIWSDYNCTNYISDMRRRCKKEYSILLINQFMSVNNWNDNQSIYQNQEFQHVLV
jgi:hypothetical protein